MEKRAFNFTRAAGDPNTGIVQGYASTFNVVDSYGTAFMPGCFRDTLANAINQVKVLWNHNENKPIGKLINAHEDNKGLFVEYRTSMGVEYAKDVFTLIMDGVIDSMSFGFNIVDYHVVDEVVQITKVNLWDVSPVTFPANLEATIIGARHHLWTPPEKEEKPTVDILGSIADEVRKILMRSA